MITPEEVVALLARYDRLKAERDSFWMPLWQSLANYVLPRKSEILAQKSPGVEGYTQDLYDVTAGQANATMAAGIMTNAAPSTERWFAFEAPAVLLRARGYSPAAAAWYQDATDIILREIATSNFYDEAHESILERGTFGTCNVMTEEGAEHLYNFRAIPVGSYVIAENRQGRVDTLFREWKWSVRQIAQEFGEAALPEKLRQQYSSAKASDHDCQYTMVHGVMPREDRQRMPGARNGVNKRFASVYIIREENFKIFEGGFDEFPFAVGRHLTWPGEVYGYGPGIDVLPTTRQVNFIERQMDALAETKAFPRVLIPSNLAGAVDLRAAGITTFDPNLPNAMPQEWGTQGEYNVGKERVETKQQFIRRAFHNDLFAMLQGIEPGKATLGEIQARMAEKLELFSPTFNRVVGEIFSPTLMRCFAIAFRAGILPEPPEEVFLPTPSGVALAMPQVVYTSRMALALKQIHNRASTDTMNMIAPVLELRPDVLDNFDLDEWARMTGRNNGMSPKLIRDPEQVAAIRAERAQAQAALETAQVAEIASKAGANAAKMPADMRREMREAIDV